MESLPKVLIVDLGSQYTKVIERTIRDLGVRSMILDPKKAEKELRNKPDLSAIILSGSGRSVTQANAPQPPKEIFETSNGHNVPILGICYGMQWMAQHYGGRVATSEGNKDYGRTTIVVDAPCVLLPWNNREMKVWASHGDSVVVLPPGFMRIAESETGGIAAMADVHRNYWGVQFHPEVTHTEDGRIILGLFLFAIAHCQKDWQPSAMIDEIRSSVASQIGNRKAILGFSGGVDSTTLAAIIEPILNDQLTCVAIDGGQLRENEIDEIKLNAAHADVGLEIISDAERFVGAIATSIDAETKRATFRRLYRECLILQARASEADVIIQGTLAPDMIESGATGSETIKTHHNVGIKLPPEWLGLHPISHLFKYEVRALAQELGLPESVWSREPFPGPGLFVRLIGTPVTMELLDLVRWADARVREIVKGHEISKKISQMPVSRVAKLVGVKGDERVYGEAIMIHPVETVDYMTANGIRLPDDLKSKIESTLQQNSKIVAVLFNETDKPPCTIEPE